MSGRRIKAKMDRRDGPTVAMIIDEMEPRRAEVLSQLRDLTLTLHGVEERTLLDVFCREWTPV